MQISPNRPFAKIAAFTAIRFRMHLPKALALAGERLSLAHVTSLPSMRAHGRFVPLLMVHGGIFADSLLFVNLR